MRRPVDRRAMLLAVAGVGIGGLVVGDASAQSAEVSGVVGFESGGVVPKGEIEIHVEDPTAQEDARGDASTTRVRSDGGSRTIGFSLSPSTSSSTAPGAEVVARLERADGWLLARGSAQVQRGLPVRITLHTVMY